MKITAISIALTLWLLPLCIHAETIQIATEEYPPHTSEKLKHYGVACHIVSEAFALEGIEVAYSFFPGKRAYMMAETGMVDGALPWVWRAEREDFFHYSEPITRGGMDGFYHLKSFHFKWNPDQPDYNDLRGLSIGAILGYNYGKDFQISEASGLISVERVPTIGQNLKKLLNGRIQLFMCQDDVGNYELHRSFNPQERAMITHTLENNRPTENFHLILSKKRKQSAHYLETFNRGLQKLKASGRYDQLIKDSQAGAYIIKEP